MQKESDKRHQQTFEAITEQGLRNPKTKKVFEGVDKLFKEFGSIPGFFDFEIK